MFGKDLLQVKMRVLWTYEKVILFEIICFQLDCSSSSIVVTEPYFNFSSIQENMNELLFEEYDFKSIFRCNSESLFTNIKTLQLSVSVTFDFQAVF